MVMELHIIKPQKYHNKITLELQKLYQVQKYCFYFVKMLIETDFLKVRLYSEEN